MLLFTLSSSDVRSPVSWSSNSIAFRYSRLDFFCAHYSFLSGSAHYSTTLIFCERNRRRFAGAPATGHGHDAGGAATTMGMPAGGKHVQIGNQPGSTTVCTDDRERQIAGFTIVMLLIIDKFASNQSGQSVRKALQPAAAASWQSVVILRKLNECQRQNV